MNSNYYDLPIPSGSRSNGVKSGTSGVCFAQRADPGIARRAESKTPDHRFGPLSQPPWQALSVRAGAVRSQTDSPERIQFGYFPL